MSARRSRAMKKRIIITSVTQNHQNNHRALRSHNTIQTNFFTPPRLFSTHTIIDISFQRRTSSLIKNEKWKKIAQNKPAQKWSYRGAAATRPERCRRLGREKEVFSDDLLRKSTDTQQTREIQDHRKTQEKHEKRRPKWEIINTLRMNSNNNIHKFQYSRATVLVAI